MSRLRTFRWGGLAGWSALTAIGCLVSTRSAGGQEVGEVFRDCDVCPEMVVVPAGSFIMGSPETEEGRRENEGPQRRVTIGYAFAVGVYEVTFAEWDACVLAGSCGGYEPGDFGYGRGRRPVLNVSWDDAWQYLDWLTEQTGEDYRLLGEAEWEYVARAGTRTARYWGESEQDQCRYANGYDSSSHAELEWGFMNPVGCRDRQAQTAPVGTYRPNAFGVYDVLGNAEEWVEDCENHSYEGAPTDGRPWYSGDCARRMVRGGSYRDDAEDIRSAQRDSRPLAHQAFKGFRVARSVR